MNSEPSKSPHVLLVDDRSGCTEQIVALLESASARWTLSTSAAEARRALRSHKDVTHVLLRGLSEQMDSVALCEELRGQYPKDRLPILALLRDREFGRGAEMLLAGCNDILVEPIRLAEFTERTGIATSTSQRRIDIGHADDEGPKTSDDGMIIPEFDPKSFRISLGPHEGMQQIWERDRSVTRIALDRIIVCPECEGIPTFRPGCGACGSAWTEQEVLIHHYACAHVGPESEFRQASGFVCPKCRLTDLVAGSDFEQTQGCQRCTDCNAIFTEPRMIAHCLCCDYRFVASDGIVRDLYGYRLPTTHGHQNSHGARSGRGPAWLHRNPQTVPGHVD